MIICATNIQKIKERTGFKAQPDVVIESFELPLLYNKIYREILYPNLQIRVKKNKKRGQKHTKTFYFVRKDKKLTLLGKFPELKFRNAVRAVENLKTVAPKIEQTTLKSAYERFKIQLCSNLKQSTITKNDKLFKTLMTFHNKPLKSLKKSDFIEICNTYYEQQKYNTAEQTFNLARSILAFSTANGLLDVNPLSGVKFKQIFSVKSGEYGYLPTEDTVALCSLIKYIYNYSNTKSVRNALVLGLLTGLRSQNVRELKKEQLKKNENGYYLEFAAEQTKANRAEKLGLPTKLALWLNSLKTNNDFFFTGATGKILSDGTLSKALQPYSNMQFHEGSRFVFHSLRKVLSSFCGKELGLSHRLAIEKCLFHDISSALGSSTHGTYDKSTYENDTRKILEFWLAYICKIGEIDVLE
ncbi:tyrosine-type recombinase/integrase [Campylobacter geochelonis]|uniref:tyrosine-type recombinase/integrase n=1 Tax=Campylobacter geochelonis TaxID=1780362 RepID=UPI00077098BE|nr:tyrosine-type recombinase/integrase [Campylobacter geochelonis]CZE47151.1 integrase phage family protein [Campylobacter geochelonis]